VTDLANYVALAAATRLLDADEERRLGRLVRRGHEASARIQGGIATADDEAMAATGAAAKRVLVESNLRLVVSIARRYPQHTLVDLSDLIQAGNQGLLTAADRFDPDRGFRFSTYATTWIRSRIGRTIDKETSALHLPIDSVNALRAAARAVDGSAGSTPGLLADLERAYSAVSLDAPLPNYQRSIGDLQASQEEPIEAQVEDRLRAQAIHGLLASLPPLHRRALAIQFGFLDGQPRSIRAVALSLGISTRQVRRLLREGEQMLKQEMLSDLEDWWSLRS
jgi:RNA polymerase sigma factor (sigma-70 family)